MRLCRECDACHTLDPAASKDDAGVACWWLSWVGSCTLSPISLLMHIYSHVVCTLVSRSCITQQVYPGRGVQPQAPCCCIQSHIFLQCWQLLQMGLMCKVTRVVIIATVPASAVAFSCVLSGRMLHTLLRSYLHGKSTKKVAGTVLVVVDFSPWKLLASGAFRYALRKGFACSCPISTLMCQKSFKKRCRQSGF